MRYLIFLLLATVARQGWSDTDASKHHCPTHFVAKLISLQGKLSVDLDGKGQWQPAHLDDSLCEGSRIQVDTYSRASLLLPDHIILRLDEGTVLTLNGIDAEKPTLLALLKGFVHFISRTPKHLEITSPIANAGPEGTEFAMRVDDKNAALWVYEGGVKFFNPQGSIHLLPGQSAQAQTGQAPSPQITIKPQDAVNWALYYPPILPYPQTLSGMDTELQLAILDFRHGRGDAALSALAKVAPEKQTAYYLKVRAAMLLSVGREQLAQQDISALLSNKPNDADALALQSVLALTQNRKEEAYQLATQAIAADNKSATAYSALSYAEQGRFALYKALTAAQQASQLAPHDAMTWARQAELELALGLTSESAKTAQHAIGLDANLERTQTVMGFADLLHTDIDAAMQSFNQAVRLDSSAPLARLGLGLTKIRQGDLAEGRQDLEIAAILDPNNSLIRSYLGKAYYEEKRNALAEEQFNLAKQRDPKDPTPYFYDAIQKQTTNRPIAAVEEMQKAVELNNNRGIYRSKLLLDQDAAAKSANFARIYTDLGFGRVALKEAWNALAYDSTNPSAHRFLSDAYIGQPRYKVARASELLQAQLLQPINITPVQPQLTSENIGILNSTGPGSLSVNEYDPLFNANGAHVVLNGAYGSNNTKTDNAIISGLYDKLSLSLGQFHYQTDGFRQNDGYQQNIYDAFAQYAITSDLSVQVELKSDETKAGDVPLRLNGFHQENLNKSIEQNTVRFGGHYRIDSTQDLIASTFYTNLKDKETNSLKDDNFTQTILNKTKQSGFQTEMQYIYHPGSFDLISGFGYIDLLTKIKNETQDFFTLPDGSLLGLCGFTIPDLCTNSVTKPNIKYLNGYIYSKQYLLPNLTTTLGFSYDSYDDSLIAKDEFNPKFGLVWSPLNNLTLRGAIFRSLKRPLITNQTLEPTQLAGFNQFYDGNNGSSLWKYGFGLDYHPVKEIYTGMEINWQKKNASLANNSQIVNHTYNESSHLAYFYWLPVDWLSIRTEYNYEKLDRNSNFGIGNDTDPVNIETHHAPISINIFQNNGLFEKLTSTYVNQKVDIPTDSLGLSIGNTSFWTFDATLGYRLPRKLGVISFEVRNLFNNKFDFQSTFDASGPQLTPYVPERQLFAKLSLFY